MQRTVTGTLRHAGGSPWSAGRVRFRLTPGSYTEDSQYPAETVTVTTDGDGEFSASLWANEEGERASKYVCTLPITPDERNRGGFEQFEFTLPPGDGSPITLSILRDAGVTQTDPQYQSILTYVLQNAIQPAQAAAAAAQAVVDEYHGVLLVSDQVDRVTLRAIDQVTFTEGEDVITVNGTDYIIPVVIIHGALP